METDIPKMKLQGRLSIWKFSPENRNYIGWNLTGDIQGCISLIDLLEQMQHASLALLRLTLITEPITAEHGKVIAGAKPFKTAQQLTLQYAKGEPQLWHTEEADEEVILSFGDREIELLQTALYRVIKGEHDFAIGDAQDEHLLYFWGYAAEV